MIIWLLFANVLTDIADKWKLDLFENSEYETIRELYENWHNIRGTEQFTSFLQSIGLIL